MNGHSNNNLSTNARDIGRYQSQQDDMDTDHPHPCLVNLLRNSSAIQFYTTTWHGHLPSVVEIAKTYPNCIVFRIGMLYSMFLLFLETLFIHWWISTGRDIIIQLRKASVSIRVLFPHSLWG